jgi:hypothetical protein
VSEPENLHGEVQDWMTLHTPVTTLFGLLDVRIVFSVRRPSLISIIVLGSLGKIEVDD